MRVLALDTSSLMSTCSVIEDNKLLGEYSLNQDMSHSEKLVPMIREVLSNLDFKIEDIDLYAVATGPGSFTGLRIGVATMKGFAQVFDKPVVGVSTLEAMAYNINSRDIIVPIIDARRNRVYVGVYTYDDGLKEILKPQVMDVDTLIHNLSSYENIIFNGDGASTYLNKIDEGLGGRYRLAPIGQNFCRATSIGELGMEKYKKGIVDDYFSLVPEYLNLSQAERELKERKQGK